MPIARRKKADRSPPSPKGYVIAIDPSLTCTGVVVLDMSGKVALQQSIETSSSHSFIVRANHIVTQICNTIYKFMGDVDHPIWIVREDFAYAASSSSDAVLKKLGGILEWEISKLPTKHSQLLYIPIASIKKFATGKGNAKKEVMMKECLKRFNFDGNADETDAFATGASVVEALCPGTFDLPLSHTEKISTIKEVLDVI